MRTEQARARGAIVALLVVAAGSSAAGPASAATTLTTGTLTDAAGQPASGEIRVYAWPHHDEAMSLPLMATAQTAADGSFTVVAANEAQLERLAAQRNGWLDFIVVGETPQYQGTSGFTSVITRNPDGLLSVPPGQVVVSGGAARAARSARAPAIRVAARRPSIVSQIGARAAQQRRCKDGIETQRPQSVPKYAIIGELNNAYNDGTRAKFSYARERSADTWFGVAESYGRGNFEITWQNHIHDRGELSFPTVQRRYARKMRSKFEFTREAQRLNTCADWDVRIRATSWLLGTDDSLRQRRALDRCDTSYVGGNDSGAEFHRDTSAAVRWTRAVEAFGVNLTSQSGFSRNVALDYWFHGPPGKKHFVCGGEDGKQTGATAGRVWSGARS